MSHVYARDTRRQGTNTERWKSEVEVKNGKWRENTIVRGEVCLVRAYARDVCFVGPTRHSVESIISCIQDEGLNARDS